MVGDIGACKELLPVATLLQRDGFEIVWVADEHGKAQDLLKKEQLPFVLGEPTDVSHPDLVVIGTSATARGAQLSWSCFARTQKHVPLIWYEDLYGTAAVSLGNGGAWEPHTLIVIDDIAHQIASTLVGPARVLVGGKPTYSNDQLSELNRSSTQIRIRTKLCLHDEFLISYISSGENPRRVSDHIGDLYPALGGDSSQKVIIRLHPKLAGEAAALMEQARNLFDNQLLDGSTITDTLDVILASDLVITDYCGDAPYQAALAGIPIIMTLFPDCEEKMRQRGYINGVPPLLMAGACWGARNPDDLEVLATGIRQAPDAAKASIKRNIKPFLPLTQKGAARKIANIVKSHFTT